MSDLTWYRVQREIRETIECDLRNGNLTRDRELDRDEIAWEYAEGDRRGFMYHDANTLWADDVEVRDFEDEAEGLGWGNAETIQERICYVVTLALRASYREALDEILDDEALADEEVHA